MKSTIQIRSAHLRANLATVRAVAGEAYEPLCVLKADAYGHGAALCAPVLVRAGVRWIGVGDVDEGVVVRQALQAAGLGDRGTRLLVMCGMEPADAPAVVAHQLTPVVWMAEQVQALEAAAKAAGVHVAVHIELDTGMARQGAAPGADLDALLECLRQAPHVQAEGLFTHLHSSEVAGSAGTAAQQVRFGEALTQVLAQPPAQPLAAVRPAFLHLGNSSAVDEHSSLPWLRAATHGMGAQLLVRPGLALYGYALPLETSETPGTPQLQPALRPVARWVTRITGLRTVQAGNTVGYGATFVAARPMRLALLPVGYADGFRREASSGVGDGWVCVAGQRAPVVGRVSMNLTVVDVSGVTPTPQTGDEAVLLGEGVTAEDHARWCGTIPYEILCGMRGHRELA